MGDRSIDPVLIEVLRHQLVSVSEEMNITMGQTARSLAAKEGGDYSDTGRVGFSTRSLADEAALARTSG